MEKGSASKQQSGADMIIRLKSDVGGKSAGTILKVPATVAHNLYQRDIAEILEKESLSAIKNKLMQLLHKRG